MKRRILYRIPREVVAREFELSSHRSAAAAPFDTPFAIEVEIDSALIRCRVVYALGGDEPTVDVHTSEGLRVSIGAESGRMMRLEASVVGGAIASQMEVFTNLVARATKSISTARLASPVAHGSPYRHEAHYQLLNGAVFPAMNQYIANKLAELRASQSTG